MAVRPAPKCPIRPGEPCTLCQLDVTGPQDCGLVYLVMHDPELREQLREQIRNQTTRNARTREPSADSGSPPVLGHGKILGTPRPRTQESHVLDLPKTDSLSSLVIRTHFGDDAAWEQVKLEIVASSSPDGFRAYVQFVDDKSYAGVTADDLTAPDVRLNDHGFVFLVDQRTLIDPEHPIIVVDLWEDPGRAFRVVPKEMWGVQNNLSISNMDFSEFADSASPDGVFRGFAEDA